MEITLDKFGEMLHIYSHFAMQKSQKLSLQGDRDEALVMHARAMLAQTLSNHIVTVTDPMDILTELIHEPK